MVQPTDIQEHLPFIMTAERLRDKHVNPLLADTDIETEIDGKSVIVMGISEGHKHLFETLIQIAIQHRMRCDLLKFEITHDGVKTIFYDLMIVAS